MSIKRLLAIASQIVVCVLITQFAFSQNKVITGKVVDDKGNAVQGATVAVKGSRTGAATDASGIFKISVAPTATTLVISSVGYAKQEIDISGKTDVAVSLVTTNASLNEIVVTGYGTARKKDLTGAVASVKEKDFNKGVFTAPDQLIQGKVAGVQVLANGGQPGGANTVKIRGNSAITGTGNPLYVIDGVPQDGRSSRPGVNGPDLGNSPAGNPLNFINPNDIASIDVLKDASATAIYGSRAAYGVIIVTTKRGIVGAPKLDLSAAVGTSDIMKKIEILNPSQFRSALSYYGVSNANDFGGNVDALGSILRSGVTQNYTAAINGGNENARYRISTGYLDQQGIVAKSDFKKYTTGITTNFKFLDSKRLGLDLNVISSQYIETLAPVTNDAGAGNSLIGQALQWNPTLPLRKPGSDSLNILQGSTINPLAMSELYNDQSKVTTILGSVSPYYKITNDLEYRFLFSINYSTGIRRTTEDQQLINLTDVAGKGWAGYSNNELVTEQILHTLSYNKQLSDNLSLNAVVGYEYMKFTNKGMNVNAYGPTPGGYGNFGLDFTNYLQYSNPSSRNISSFIDPTSELQSYFGRAVLNWKDRFLVTATFRSDGSSKFGANNKYGSFPSFSAAWNITKEDFFKVDFINQLKLRGGWGKTGNQEFPAGSAQAKYSFQNNGGLGQVNNPNPDLKWQSDQQWDIGLDFTIWKNRLSGTIDYFDKNTTDLLYPTFPIQPAPPGTVPTWKNLPGHVYNKGWEVTLNAIIIQTQDLTWNFGVNASFINNDVEGNPAPIATGALHGQGVTGTLVETIRNGYPINAFWTRHFEGLDKTTGQATYTNNGNTFDYEGDPNPKTVLGISTSLNYKKFALTINMNGAFGQKIYNNTLNNVINVGDIAGGRNIALSVYQNPIKEAFSNPVTSSSRFIEDGSYLKMANATISYNIGKIGNTVKNINVFVTGQNLFVITNFSGFDPEVNVDKSFNGVPSVGIEYQPYPTARTITAGVNFSL